MLHPHCFVFAATQSVWETYSSLNCTLKFLYMQEKNEAATELGWPIHKKKKIIMTNTKNQQETSARGQSTAVKSSLQSSRGTQG